MSLLRGQAECSHCSSQGSVSHLCLARCSSYFQVNFSDCRFVHSFSPEAFLEAFVSFKRFAQRTLNSLDLTENGHNVIIFNMSYYFLRGIRTLRQGTRPLSHPLSPGCTWLTVVDTGIPVFKGHVWAHVPPLRGRGRCHFCHQGAHTALSRWDAVSGSFNGDGRTLDFCAQSFPVCSQPEIPM